MERTPKSCHRGTRVPVSEASQTSVLRFPDDSGRSLGETLDELPIGAVLEIAPGRYDGPVAIRRACALRGAGDLTRIELGEGAVSIEVDGAVELSSLAIEGGEGVEVRAGDVRLHNVHVQNARSTFGGALTVHGGNVEAHRLRVGHAFADEGGGVGVGAGATLLLEDSQVEDTEAARGGAFFLKPGAEVRLVGVTIRKARASAAQGGQALYVDSRAEQPASLAFERVRLEDVPLGLPLVVDPAHVPNITIRGCDMPRIVLDTPGVVDEGENDWR